MKVTASGVKAALASFGRVTAAVALSAEAVQRGLDQINETTAANPDLDYSDPKTLAFLLVGPAIITVINAWRTGEPRFGRGSTADATGDEDKITPTNNGSQPGEPAVSQDPNFFPLDEG